MNNNAAFLLIAIGVSIAASMALWLRTKKPTTFMSSIDNFQREMAALARDPHEEITPPRRPTKLKPIVPSRDAGSLAEKFRSARQSAGDEIAERRGARRDRHRAGSGTIVPSQGRGDLADRLTAAPRRGSGQTHGFGGRDASGDSWADGYRQDAGAPWDDGG